MKAKRILHITSSEFQSLAGTELFAKMISRKFLVSQGDKSTIDVISYLEKHLTSVWYCSRIPVEQDTYIVYLSSDTDIEVIKREIDEEQLYKL